jgi:hypothetical protein
MVDSIFLYPHSHSFDVETCRRHLMTELDSLEDPLGTGKIMLCGDIETLEGMRAKRLKFPDRFPYSALVTIEPKSINIFQERAGLDKLISSRRFLSWLLNQYRCQITDEYGTDFTERYAEEGIDIFYPPNLDQLAADQLLPLEQRPRR